MKKLLLNLIIVAAICINGAFASPGSIEDFYYNLSSIIEKNISRPKTCVKKVDRFIKKNKELIEQVKKERQQRIQATSSKSQAASKNTQSAILDTQYELSPQAQFNRVMSKLSEKDPKSGQKIMMLHSRAIFGK